MKSCGSAAATDWSKGPRPSAGGRCNCLRYQRAEDRLLAEAAADSSGGAFYLIKNDRDSRGNIYGAQENYEATLASGWRLAVWRAGVFACLPLVLLVWLGVLALLGFYLTYLILAGLIYPLLGIVTGKPRGVQRLLFGDLFQDNEEFGPPWLEAVVNGLTRVICAPLAAGLSCLLWLTAFRRTLRELTPFLVSRPVFAGAGMLDDRGRFWLADKATGLNCLVGFGGLVLDRPAINFGHFFKTLFVEAWRVPRGFLCLLRSQQRLQIAVGDSNMAQTAEYLRIGTTLLVLDAIEAGALREPPRVRRPIKALRTVCGDPTLQAEVRLAGGRRWTAIELQRYYLHACRDFLDSQPRPPAEAVEVLQRWEEVLDALETSPERLFGSIDWVTKQSLLEQAGRDAPWEARKKIDLRYHELSPEGYFARLEQAGLAPRLVDDQEIEAAIRTPPGDSPASTRGRYIREFSRGLDGLKVNWEFVILGGDMRKKIIRLAEFVRHKPEG